MEASFCGSEVGPDKGFHYTRLHLENMGQMFGRTLYDYFYIENPPQQESPIAAAAEPKGSPALSKSNFKSTNTVVDGILSKIKQEIRLGNPAFLETYASSDSDTSSDEEQLRLVIKKKPKNRAKSHFTGGSSKILSTEAPDSPESNLVPESKDKKKRRSSAPSKSILNHKLSNSRVVSNQVIYAL
jgi:hypothetical protein